MGRFESKTVMVTGESSGIGRATALAFAAEGANTLLVARRADSLRELAAEIEGRGHPRATVLSADLSTRGVARELAARATESHGVVDVLVNNAGVGFAGSQLGVADADEARSAFETNYWSPLALASALFREPVARPGRAIVNVTSLIAAVPVALAGHYSSSKSALALATEAMRIELVGRDVHVLHVLPGPIETPMLGNMRTMRGAAKVIDRIPRGEPSSIAAAMLDALASRRPDLVHPASLAFVRHVPTLMLAAVRARARPLRSGDDGLVVPSPTR